jgi:acyl carrier protein
MRDERNQVEKELKFLVAEQQGISVDTILPESRFIEDLKLDSLDIVEVEMAVEEVFQIEFLDEEIEKISTFQEAVNLVCLKISNHDEFRQKPKEFTLKIRKVQVILSSGTDKIYILFDAPTSFPELGYEPAWTIEVRHDYGVTWCREVLNVEPQVINTRFYA